MNGVVLSSMPLLRVAAVVACSAVALVVMTGCSQATTTESKPREKATPSASASPVPERTAGVDAGDPKLADAFAERDAFFAEQGFTGNGPLKATTEAQRALVQAQKEWTEAKGGVWDDRSETILLALGSDTCETGILNQHRVDGITLKKLIGSSPLVAQLMPKDASADQAALYERNIASTSVFSASYLCPADKDAWEAAFRTAYPG
jgi:hypothetical protein